MGFQGRDEESLRKVALTSERSAQLVQAAHRRTTSKELARSVRRFLNLGSRWHQEEMREALSRFDEAHRE